MKTILLAERDAFLIGVYAKEFRNSGFSVSIARDEKNIINRIKNINPDVLILDAFLEKDAGAAILRELKNDLQSKDLKIILLSYFGKPEGFEEFIGEKNIKCFSKSEYAAKELADEIKILIS